MEVLLGEKIGVPCPICDTDLVSSKKSPHWDVFIPMLCEDFFPSSRVVGDAEAYEEERRVFYVAATRTKDELYLISPTVIESYRGLQTVRVSQFIEELKPKVYKRSSVRYNPAPINKKHSKKSKGSLFTTANKLRKE